MWETVHANWQRKEKAWPLKPSYYFVSYFEIHKGINLDETQN